MRALQVRRIRPLKTHASIRQNRAPAPLPDFRNLGVMLRDAARGQRWSCWRRPFCARDRAGALPRAVRATGRAASSRC
ncbi:MAG: hypothetical protein MZW92_11325 [Comamonadaceae bacterium]|nr:hypothetical protein [Comamonadaceae bacterium]